MGKANVRFGFNFGANAVGLGSSSPSYYVDSSKRPIVMERIGNKFRLACDVIVSEPDQTTFQSSCSSLESVFDESSGRNSTVLIRTDTQLVELFDPTGGSFFQISNYSVLGGKTFTITVNGTATVLTAGVNFAAVTSNAVTAANLATAILGISAVFAIAIGANVYVFPRDESTYSLTLATNAGAGASANLGVGAGYNAKPSISKPGSDDDTATSRRYQVEIVLDLPMTGTGRSGRRDSSWRLTEIDSRRRRLQFDGTWTGFGSLSAYEAYSQNIDPYVLKIQKCLSGTSTVWEGPFDVRVSGDDEYDVPQDGSGKAARLLTYTRTYEELIYNDSLGTLDDVRLRRKMLKVRKAISQPGDYAPGGSKPVFRLQTATISYSTAVDKTVTQDLKGIYDSVVKPFLVDEAKKALGTGNICVSFHEPELDRQDNRIACSMTVIAVSGSNLVASRVTTEDEDDPGTTLVAVWDDNALSKEEFDGAATLRRTVTQVYMIVGPPAGAKDAAGGSRTAGVDQFGIFAINKPLAFDISAPNATEAAIDSFFGLNAGGRTKKGDEAAFPTSGGVPEPSGLRRIYRGGYVKIDPRFIGDPSLPQIQVTEITKIKRYEYINDPNLGGGPPAIPTLKDYGNNGDDAGGPLKTRSR